jgi:hypothetical protein
MGVLAMRHLCALSTVVVSAAALAQPTPRPEGQLQHHGAIGFIAPAGWTARDGGNGLTVLTFPVAPQEQPCEIRMLPPMRLSGDLATQAASMVQGFSNANRLGPYQGQFGRDVRLAREEGISGTGWNYVDLSGQLGQSGITVRVLMAQMSDGQVLPIVGFSKVWKCLGNQSTRDNDIWALLFHSLQLPGYATESPQLAQQLVGMWSSASGGAGTAEIFAPNGHFSTVGVYQSYETSSTPGMVWEVDRSWQGEGTYEVHGDQVHEHNAKRTDDRRDVTRYFSIVRVPNENAAGGYEYVLRLVDRSWNGSPTWGFSPSGNFVTHMAKSNPRQ